jgi:hypothetical protein
MHNRDKSIGKKNLGPRVTVFFHVHTYTKINLTITELGDIVGIISKKVNVHSWRSHLHSFNERYGKDSDD